MITITLYFATGKRIKYIKKNEKDCALHHTIKRLDQKETAKVIGMMEGGFPKLKKIMEVIAHRLYTLALEGAFFCSAGIDLGG